MPAVGAPKPRPPLPGGPYLIVGLARSGVAAALVLRARGEEVIGCDAGPPGTPALDDAAERLSAAGVEVHLDASGDALAARAGTLIKSPGVPQNAPVVAAARAGGVPVVRGARARLAAVGERIRGGDGHQWQDDDHRVDRPYSPRGGSAGRGGRQRRDRADVAGGGGAGAGHHRVRGVLVPARGHDRLRARGRGAAQPRARPPGPPRDVCGLRRRQAEDLRQPGQ